MELRECLPQYTSARKQARCADPLIDASGRPATGAARHHRPEPSAERSGAAHVRLAWRPRPLLPLAGRPRRRHAGGFAPRLAYSPVPAEQLETAGVRIETASRRRFPGVSPVLSLRGGHAIPPTPSSSPPDDPKAACPNRWAGRSPVLADGPTDKIVVDPWAAGALSCLDKRRPASVVVIGSGLTRRRRRPPSHCARRRGHDGVASRFTTQTFPGDAALHGTAQPRCATREVSLEQLRDAFAADLTRAKSLARIGAR